jgi:hypothetical protein
MKNKQWYIVRTRPHSMSVVEKEIWDKFEVRACGIYGPKGALAAAKQAMGKEKYADATVLLEEISWLRHLFSQLKKGTTHEK